MQGGVIFASLKDPLRLQSSDLRTRNASTPDPIQLHLFTSRETLFGDRTLQCQGTLTILHTEGKKNKQNKINNNNNNMKPTFNSTPPCDDGTN